MVGIKPIVLLVFFCVKTLEMNRALNLLIVKRAPLFFKYSRNVFVPQTKSIWKTYSTEQKKITIETIKEFRKLTDAPLGKCKKALEECVS